jgi:hypothetical protein
MTQEKVAQGDQAVEGRNRSKEFFARKENFLFEIFGSKK